MLEEKTETNMGSSAATTITSSSSAIGVQDSASILASTSFQPLSNPSPPTITPSLNPEERYGSKSSHSSFPPSQSSPKTAEVITSNPATTSPPQLTPFPDLNLQTATLLARLKNPSLLSNEELQSATAEAVAALSAWKSEWLNIDDTKRRGRGLKPAAHLGIRPRSPNTLREEKNRFWENWNEQERLGMGVWDVGFRAVGRVELSLAAEAGPSRASAEAEAEEGKTVTMRSPQNLMQEQIDPSTGGRGQRAHKRRQFSGETSLATRFQRRGPYEGAREISERRALAIAQPLPKQEATMAKPNTGLAGKRKREDRNKKGEEKLAAEPSRQKKTRVSSAAPAPSQQPRVKLRLILNSPKPAPDYPTNLRAINTEPSPRTTQSMSKAFTPAIAKKTISQAASASASALGGKRKCLHDIDDGEQAFHKAKKMTLHHTNRARSNAQAPTTASLSPEDAVKHARHSAIMRAVWVKRRAEGTSGLYGGQPSASTVERWKRKMAKMGGGAES